jgi:hypothetical protein
MTPKKQWPTLLTLIAFSLTALFYTPESSAMGRRTPEEQTARRHTRHRNTRKVKPSQKSTKTETNSNTTKENSSSPKHLAPFFQHYKTANSPLPKTLRAKLQHVIESKTLNPNQEKHEGFPLLLFAAHMGDLETLQILAQAKADLEVMDRDGKTAWITATRAQQTHVLFFLRNAGVNIHHHDSQDRSALTYAALQKNFDLFLKLLILGMEARPENLRGITDQWIYNKVKILEKGWALLQNSHTIDEFLYAKSVIFAEFMETQPLSEGVKRYIHSIGRKIYLTQKYQELRALSTPSVDTHAPEKKDFTEENPQPAFEEEDPSIPPHFEQHSQLRPDLVPLPGALMEEADPQTSPTPISPPHPDCIICLERLNSLEADSQDLQHSGPAECSCYICTPCTKTWIEFQVDHCGESSYNCPGCEKIISLEHLRKHGSSEEQILKLAQVYVERTLSKDPNWLFCRGSNCTTGKAIEEGSTATFYSCFLCDFEGCIRCGEAHLGGCDQAKQENEATQKELHFLITEGLQAPPLNRSDILPDDPLYYRGRFRPCYFCGTIVERTMGCNSMICANPKCGKKWHWNYGDHKLHPANITTQGNAIMHDRDCIEAHYQPLKPAHF